VSVNKVEEYLSQIYKLIPQKIKKYGRTNAFRDMWNLSYMSSVLPFDEVWEIVDENLVRPKERAFKWGWSSSEKAAFDFFLGIYNREHPERKTDLMYAIYRWPPETSIGKVIISWMDSPFWF
jgi:hypothetical protein